MPYKNPDDRRKAWNRWYSKNHAKQSVVDKRKARDLAYWSNRKPEKCSIENCGDLGERHHEDYSKPKEIIWLCKKHHEMAHSKPSCTVEGCTMKHLARGFCQKHYSQWRCS